MPADNPVPPDKAPPTPNLQASLEPPSTANIIFFGADGLRAGWSLLIFVALLAVVMFAAFGIGKILYPTQAHVDTSSLPVGIALIGEVIPFFAVLLVAWIMSKIEGRANGVYGLGGRYKVQHFLAGLGWGVACLSLLVFALREAGFLVFDSRLLRGGDILRYGAVWLIAFLFVGLFEEYVMRGYLQYTVARGLAGFYRWAFRSRNSVSLGYWSSALLISCLFGLGHGKNPGESPIGLVAAGFVGLVFCLSLWRTGSLWWAIGMHAGWDWAQSFLYGVPDSGGMVAHHLMATRHLGKTLLSGGTTGPEGSILVLPVLLLITLIIVFTLPQTGAYAANMPAGTLASDRPEIAQTIPAQPVS